MRSLVLALCACLTTVANAHGLLGAGPRGAAVGNNHNLSAPVKLGVCSSVVSGTTCVLTVTNNCAAGSMIWVAGGWRANASNSITMTDSGPNTYVAQAQIQVPTNGWDSRNSYSINTSHALTSGVSTITGTYAVSGTQVKNFNAYCIANNGGSFALDQHTTTTGTTSTIAAGPLTSGSANAIAFTSILTDATTAITYAPGTWTVLDNNNGGGFINLMTSYELLPISGTGFSWSSSGCVTGCPTTTNWAQQLTSFHD